MSITVIACMNLTILRIKQTPKRCQIHSLRIRRLLNIILDAILDSYFERSRKFTENSIHAVSI